MDLLNKIKKLIVPKNSVGIFWLGQAGFILKLSNGFLIAIDPYLSDCCQKEYSNNPIAFNRFKRMIHSPLNVKDLNLDLIIISHEHYDHLDIYSVPILLQKPNTKLAGPESVIRKCIELNINVRKLIKLKVGNKRQFSGFSILPVFSDHGELEPFAIGFILEFENFKLYFTGDTAYSPNKLYEAIKEKPDIILPPINGLYGNLNTEEAAKLSRDVSAKICIPCHYWMFVEHGGDPYALNENLKKYAPDCRVRYLAIGEEYIYPNI